MENLKMKVRKMLDTTPQSRVIKRFLDPALKIK